MTGPAPLAPPKPRFWRMHLSTAVLLMLAVPVWALCFVHSNAWAPESTTMSSLDEVATRFPGWVTKSVLERTRSPDGTRCFSTFTNDRKLYGNGTGFNFSRYDYDSDLKFVLGQATASSPTHYPLGFVDDDHCIMMMSIVTGHEMPVYHAFRVWYRRFPEWWWGQFYRPEVWLGIVFAGVLGVKFVRAIWNLRASRAT